MKKLVFATLLVAFTCTPALFCVRPTTKCPTCPPKRTRNAAPKRTVTTRTPTRQTPSKCSSCPKANPSRPRTTPRRK